MVSWKKKFVSKAGKLILIRSVLSGIPIYFFLTVHIPCLVCKDVLKLMGSFLCEGVEEGEGALWVRWEVIGKSVNLGG